MSTETNTSDSTIPMFHVNECHLYLMLYVPVKSVEENYVEDEVSCSRTQHRFL